VLPAWIEGAPPEEEVDGVDEEQLDEGARLEDFFGYYDGTG